MDQNKPKRRVSRPVLVALGIVGTFAFLIAIIPDVRMVQIQSTPARVKADITVIKEALDAYAMQHEGDYPDGLHALVVRDEHGERYLNLERVPRDPWKREYIYVRGATVDVLTYGCDGVPGGDGDDADVSYLSMVSENE